MYNTYTYIMCICMYMCVCVHGALCSVHLLNCALNFGQGELYILDKGGCTSLYSFSIQDRTSITAEWTKSIGANLLVFVHTKLRMCMFAYLLWS